MRALASVAATLLLCAGPSPDAVASVFLGYYTTGSSGAHHNFNIGDGITSFTTYLADDEPIILVFRDEGAWPSEQFDGRILSRTGAMRDLNIRWEGPAFTGFELPASAWTSPWVPPLITEQGVSVRTASVSHGEGFYQAYLTFDEANPPYLAFLNFTINPFLPANTQFTIEFQQNLGAPFGTPPVGTTPIPGAFWLLATVMAGMLGLGRARKRPAVV